MLIGGGEGRAQNLEVDAGDGGCRGSVGDAGDSLGVDAGDGGCRGGKDEDGDNRGGDISLVGDIGCIGSWARMVAAMAKESCRTEVSRSASQRLFAPCGYVWQARNICSCWRRGC
jgi:hypothetical protein